MRHTKNLSSYAFTLAGALALMGCGPSPEDVCDKMFSLAEAEIGADATKAALGDKAECIKKETHRKEMQGIFKYKDNNACVMDASSWKDAQACAKKK